MLVLNEKLANWKKKTERRARAGPEKWWLCDL
jgi:hypothetical protein